MFKGIDFRLNVDVLYCLCVMGYGDVFVILDMNFFLDSVVWEMVYGFLLWMENFSVVEVIEVILLVLFLDMFVEDFVMCMEIVGVFEEILDVQSEVQVKIDKVEGGFCFMIGVE